MGPSCREGPQQAVESTKARECPQPTPQVRQQLLGALRPPAARQCLRAAHLQLESSKALLDELLSLLGTLLRAACAAEQGIEGHLGRLLL